MFAFIFQKNSELVIGHPPSLGRNRLRMSTRHRNVSRKCSGMIGVGGVESGNTRVDRGSLREGISVAYIDG